jgi:hypothetical protein
LRQMVSEPVSFAWPIGAIFWAAIWLAGAL